MQTDISTKGAVFQGLFQPVIQPNNPYFLARDLAESHAMISNMNSGFLGGDEITIQLSLSLSF